MLFVGEFHKFLALDSQSSSLLPRITSKVLLSCLSKPLPHVSRGRVHACKHLSRKYPDKALSSVTIKKSPPAFKQEGKRLVTWIKSLTVAAASGSAADQCLAAEKLAAVNCQELRSRRWWLPEQKCCWRSDRPGRSSTG